MRAISTISRATYGGSHPLIYRACLVLAGTALIALSAQVTLPLLPVPITLQTTAILFLSIIFGPALGATAVAGYLLEGALGFPVFAGFSAGFPILLGQTGGYLIGFLPAAIVSGYLAQKGWNKGIKVFFQQLGRLRPRLFSELISPARQSRADGDQSGALHCSPLDSPSLLTPPQAAEISQFKSI